MYNTLKNWADTYQPLTRQEELEITIECNGDRTKLFEILLKHNARMIVGYVNSWTATYDIDDACGMIIEKLIRTFDRYDADKGFYYFAVLRMKAALHSGKHRYASRDHEDIDGLEISSDTCEEYDDLMESISTCLSPDEYNTILKVFRDGESIKDSVNGNNNRSRRFNKILDKIRKHLKESGEIENLERILKNEI